MLKLLASRFADFTPALVNEQQNSVFDANLNALAASEDSDKLLAADAQVSADSNFWLDADNCMARYRPYKVQNGMLLIPVAGVLLHNYPWATPWATGYTYLYEAFKRGAADMDVKKIGFLIHSGGGEVAGCFEAVEKMIKLKEECKKPVRAFAHEYAYSAAYAVATVADTIVVSRTGGVGSIGVVTSHVDYSKMLEDIGMKITFITFGKHKVDGNPYEALSPEAKDRIQSRINELGEVFVATVAKNRRKMDAKAVRDTEALTYTASEAIKIGLADEVGPLDEAMAAFAADPISTEEEDEQMSNATATANQAELETARAEGHAKGLSEGKVLGATEAKTRIDAILGCENAKERPVSALAAAMDTDMTAEQANVFLGKLAVEAPAAKTEDKSDDKAKTENKGENAQNFDKAMKDGKPEVGGNAADQGKNDADADSADGVLDLAASAGIPGLRKRKQA